MSISHETPQSASSADDANRQLEQDTLPLNFDGATSEAVAAETPVHTFDKTSLQEAVDQDLVHPLPDTPRVLLEGNQSMPSTIEQTSTDDKRKKPVAWIAGGIVATLLAGGGIFAVLKGHDSDPEAHALQPVATSTPNTPTPSVTSAPTPSESPTTTPSVTTSTEATPTASETAPTVAPGEIPSKTEDVIPLADFQTYVKANKSFTADLLKQHPEAFGFMSEPRVDTAIGEGVLTKANITDYLKTLKAMTAKKGFTSLFDSFSSANPKSYAWLNSSDVKSDPKEIATINDQFAYEAIAGSKGYGKDYWKLTSLNPELRESFKADEEKQLKMGNNPDGTFSLDDFKVLDAFNKPINNNEVATMLLTYKKFHPNRSGVAIEHLDWLVMTHLPAHVVDTGDGDPHPDEVTGLMFDQLDITAN